MMPSREHFLLKRRNALSTFSFSPTLTVDISFSLSFAVAFIDYPVIIAISKCKVKLFLTTFCLFLEKKFLVPLAIFSISFKITILNHPILKYLTFFDILVYSIKQ